MVLAEDRGEGVGVGRERTFRPACTFDTYERRGGGKGLLHSSEKVSVRPIPRHFPRQSCLLDKFSTGIE